MLLTDARRPTRTLADGTIVALAEQDRRRCNRDRIAEGVALITETLPRGPVGPYQLQASIAAIHDEAAHMVATDWPQILALYELLEQIAPNPMVTLPRSLLRCCPAGHQPAGVPPPQRSSRAAGPVELSRSLGVPRDSAVAIRSGPGDRHA